MEVAYTFASVILVSVISLIGVIVLIWREQFLRKIMFFLIAFAVGALLGDAFIHLLPETIEIFGGDISASMLVLAGFLIFFVIEKLIHFHHLHIHDEMKYKPYVYINLLGDAFHNFIDGLLIAGSFAVSIPVGIATTLAVILHEIPQEIGDFGVLIHGGMKPKKALGFNLLSALTAVLGAAVGLVLLESVEAVETLLLPLTAGGFIYIAASDLIPELHRQTHEGTPVPHPQASKKSHHLRIWVQVAGIGLGIFLMYALTFVE